MSRKIIGHRGAAGLALENSAESLLSATHYQLDAIEFDVRLTKDQQLVILHDRHTGRVANQRIVVHQRTLSEIKKIPLKNGQSILTLDEALALLKDQHVIIESKDCGVAEKLPEVMKRHPNVQASFLSFRRSEVKRLRQLFPDSTIYIATLFRPIAVALFGKQLKATGIATSIWLTDPLTYWLAQKFNLEVIVYSVDNPHLYRLLRRFYPKISLVTNHPEYFVGARTIKNTPATKVRGYKL
ncbi:MAG TPA: glycerophosphodiester phosphodiesterase family protein [Candidatus Saccharimonadales bacterium]|nr:glycerophosphodiester phosphodiesterase family protein [Candidatus Saccharimonadales bacterium]